MIESIHYIPPYAMCRHTGRCDPTVGLTSPSTVTAASAGLAVEPYEPAPDGSPSGDPPASNSVPPPPPVPADAVAPNPFPVPVPLVRPTLIIWQSKDCSACKNSGPTFRALQNNRSGWDVVQREATRDVIMRYPSHILSLPMYDFLTPSPNASASANPLGIPGVSITTVRNNSPSTLVAMVPDLSVGAH